MCSLPSPMSYVQRYARLSAGRERRALPDDDVCVYVVVVRRQPLQRRRRPFQGKDVAGSLKKLAVTRVSLAPLFKRPRDSDVM